MPSSKSARLRASLAVAVLGTAVLLGWLLLRRGPDGATPPPSPAPAGPAAASNMPAGTGPRRAWTVGDRRRYALTTTRTIEFRSPGSKQALRIDLSGTWETTVVHLDALAVHVLAQLSQPKLTMTNDDGSGPERAQQAAVLRAATAPLFLQQDPWGRLRAVRLRRGEEELGRGLVQSLAALTQLVEPAEAAGAQKWTAIESDTTGSYEAAYERQEGGTRCAKRRLKYTQIASAQGMMPVAELGKVQSALALTFALDPGGMPAAITGTESLDIDAGAGVPRVVSTSTLTLTLLAADQDAQAAARWAMATGPDFELLPLGVASGAAAAKREDEALVKGLSFEQLLAQLGGLGPAADGKARAQLHERLAALFRLDESAPQRAKETLQRGLPRDAARTLVGALGSAGTAAAQQALIQVAQTVPLGAELRSNALAMTGLAEQPTEATAEALLQATRDPDPEVRSTAALALGNTARSLQDHGQTGDADEAVEALLKKLAAAQTPAEQTLYLQALGNAGDARALPAIQPLLASPVAAVRAAAVVALRFIREGQDGTQGTIDALLAQALHDPAAEVRRGAVFAAGFRELGVLLQPLRAALVADADTRVRLSIVQLFGKNLGLPGTWEALTTAATKDPSPDVRSAAQSLLSSSRR